MRITSSREKLRKKQPHELVLYDTNVHWLTYESEKIEEGQHDDRVAYIVYRTKEDVACFRNVKKYVATVYNPAFRGDGVIEGKRIAS